MAYITLATKHYYVYSFLNPNVVGKGGVAGYVFGIAAGIIIIFSISKGLQRLRKWATEQKLGMTGKFFAGRDMGQGDVELETQRVWEKPLGSG